MEKNGRTASQRAPQGWLIFLLVFSLILLAVDRTAARLYVPRAEARTVVLFTTDWCPYCKSLRIYLDAHHVPYIEHDIEKSLSGMMGFWALRGRGVPVSTIGPKVIRGYDLKKINDALKALGYEVDEDESANLQRQI